MTQNNRILIVDDNEAIHGDFRKVLGVDAALGALDRAAASLFEDEPSTADLPSKRIYELDSAYQGRQALQLLKQSIVENRPYALAFVDIRMPPGWDGIETVQRFWEVAEDLQVVICTAYSDYSWNDMIQKLGETDRLVVIKKPFDNIEVRQIACALTTKWVLTRQSKRTLMELSEMVDRRTASLADANRRLQVEMAEKEHAAEVLHNTEARCARFLKRPPTAFSPSMTTGRSSCSIRPPKPSSDSKPKKSSAETCRYSCPPMIPVRSRTFSHDAWTRRKPKRSGRAPKRTAGRKTARRFSPSCP